MNKRMFEDAQDQMAAVEALRQELIAISSSVPFDKIAFDAKHDEYGAAFIAASAAVAEATYAPEE